MTKLKRIQQWIGAAGTAVVLAVTVPAFALGLPVSEIKLILVIDDSGTVRQTEKEAGMSFEAMKEVLMVTVSNLRTQRRYLGATIDVFTTSAGRMVWSDTVANIQSARGLALKQAIQGHPRRCQDFEKTFKVLDRHLRFVNEDHFREVRIIFMSGFFHSGSPCGHLKELVYPSEMPQGLDFAKILTQTSTVKSIKIFGMHPGEQADWGEALAPLLKWQKDEAGRVFELYTDTQTPAALMRGLGG